MSERKKSPLVVQSNKLVESRYTLTVGEQRLLYAMISLIHPDDIDFKPYVLRVQDLAFYLNINIKNAYREADKITTRIMERVLHIPQENGDLLKVHWVSSALHSKGQVELSFNPKLKPYLLQMKERFTSSQLSLITQFQSFYSIRIYNLLKQYQKIGYREIDLIKLREILGIKETLYKEFKEFKRRVLNQAKKEFETKVKGGTYKSDITFDLETIRTGRRITRLKFYIRKQAYQQEFPVEIDIEQAPEISKMIYFGIGKKLAFELYQKHGATTIKNALDLYGERVEAGKVKRTGGGYLKKLVEEGAGGMSDYEKDVAARKQKEKAAAQKKKLDEARAKQKAAAEREAQVAKFNALPELARDDILREFQETLEPVAAKRYVKDGLDSSMVNGLFNHYLNQIPADRLEA